jgi:hypothetical protein
MMFFCGNDSDLIYDEIVSHGGKAIAASKNMNQEVIESRKQSKIWLTLWCVQGDEPFMRSLCKSD